MNDVASFSRWLHWDQQSASAEQNGPGVYLLGRFEEGPPIIADPGDDRVLLIAETHNQSLADRWYQFHRCAFNGAEGHSGGRTFYRLFTNGPGSAVPGWLYVAATNVIEEDRERCTKGLKNRLLKEYEERHGRLPSCNTNGPAGPEPRAEISIAKIDAVSTTPVVAKLALLFSPWISWKNRKELPGRESAGVYLLARFESRPPSKVDILDKSIVYVGETCENSLIGRLSQFNRSAFLGKDGHSGGLTYRDQFADIGDDLYVSACAVRDLAAPHRSAFIRWAERQVLLDYVMRWSRQPICNTK